MNLNQFFAVKNSDMIACYRSPRNGYIAYIKGNAGIYAYGDTPSHAMSNLAYVLGYLDCAWTGMMKGAIL